MTAEHAKAPMTASWLSGTVREMDDLATAEDTVLQGWRTLAEVARRYNAYDELVAMAEEIVQAADKADRVSGIDPECWAVLVARDSMRDARAALAKAAKDRRYVLARINAHDELVVVCQRLCNAAGRIDTCEYASVPIAKHEWAELCAARIAAIATLTKVGKAQ